MYVETLKWLLFVLQQCPRILPRSSNVSFPPSKHIYYSQWLTQRHTLTHRENPLLHYHCPWPTVPLHHVHFWCCAVTSYCWMCILSILNLKICLLSQQMTWVCIRNRQMWNGLSIVSLVCSIFCSCHGADELHDLSGEGTVKLIMAGSQWGRLAFYF